MTLKEYDAELKLVLVGDSGVGKSALIARLVDDKFSSQTLSTIGVDFRFRSMQVDEKKVKLQIWDTAGQDNFRSIVSAYYKGTHGIVIVFDLKNQKTLSNIQQFWLKEARDHADSKAVIMLIGNKCDLHQLQVTKAAIEQFNLKNNVHLYFQTSARTAQDVDLAFRTLAKQLLAQGVAKKQKPAVTLQSPLTPSPDAPKKSKKCCE